MEPHNLFPLGGITLRHSLAGQTGIASAFLGGFILAQEIYRNLSLEKSEMLSVGTVQLQTIFSPKIAENKFLMCFLVKRIYCSIM